MNSDDDWVLQSAILQERAPDLSGMNKGVAGNISNPFISRTDLRTRNVQCSLLPFGCLDVERLVELAPLEGALDLLAVARAVHAHLVDVRLGVCRDPEFDGAFLLCGAATLSGQGAEFLRVTHDVLGGYAVNRLGGGRAIPESVGGLVNVLGLEVVPHAGERFQLHHTGGAFLEVSAAGHGNVSVLTHYYYMHLLPLGGHVEIGAVVGGVNIPGHLNFRSGLVDIHINVVALSFLHVRSRRLEKVGVAHGGSGWRSGRTGGGIAATRRQHGHQQGRRQQHAR